MKRASTLIMVIVVIAVLIGALGVGFGIKKARELKKRERSKSPLVFSRHFAEARRCFAVIAASGAAEGAEA